MAVLMIAACTIVWLRRQPILPVLLLQLLFADVQRTSSWCILGRHALQALVGHPVCSLIATSGISVHVTFCTLSSHPEFKHHTLGLLTVSKLESEPTCQWGKSCDVSRWGPTQVDASFCLPPMMCAQWQERVWPGTWELWRI